MGTRSAATLLLGASAAAFILNGSTARAVSCSFGDFSGCTTPVGNLSFSNFTYDTGSSISSGDLIQINSNAGVYNFDAFFTNPLASTGTFSFTVTAASGYVLSGALSNLADVNASTFSTSLSGFTANPLIDQSGNFQNFNAGVTSTNAVVTWNATSGSLTQYELDLTTAQVPAPFPVLGAAAAFRFSRKLRKRVQARA